MEQDDNIIPGSALIQAGQAGQQPLTPSRISRGASVAIALSGVGICLLLASWIYLRSQTGFYYMPSESMEPTLMGHESGQLRSGGTAYTDTVHDELLTSKLPYRSHPPTRNDIIVFMAPREADMESLQSGRPQKQIVMTKRIVGVPGDTIEIRENQTVTFQGKQITASVVLRNGETLDELSPSWPYHILEPMNAQTAGARVAINVPVTLSPHHYFVLGDNRNNSNDSRYWGLLDETQIQGKVVRVISPPQDARVIP